MTDQEKNAIEEAYAESLKEVFGVFVNNLAASKGNAAEEKSAETAFRDGVDLVREAKAKALAIL